MTYTIYTLLTEENCSLFCALLQCFSSLSKDNRVLVNERAAAGTLRTSCLVKGNGFCGKSIILLASYGHYSFGLPSRPTGPWRKLSERVMAIMTRSLNNITIRPDPQT
ncbi:hypothetical protein NQ317_005986 [Molorchus minor]|uniref:Uncharacterized protein n=1 Tax=Molorchus minor TaxID=1323400 RepID=A0ABQ9ISM1_9CUCU|nr:hypothetical protein NQ317_005986 [Molorchus minor]